jgi:chloramphenicol-sensitive protein RarD
LTERSKGLLYAIAAYGWWGFVAVYFKFVREVPPLEILAHRVIWSVAVLLALITFSRNWRALAGVFKNRRALGYLAGTTVLIAVNWFVFIWAVTNDRMVDSSLGYYINPIVSVLLGFLFLRERLRRWEWVAVGLAASSVAWLTLSLGVFPWIAVILALTFGLYGLLRKLAHVGSLEGLTVETLLLLPLAAGYLFLLASDGRITFGTRSTSLDLLLLAAGPVTALPLLWFAAGVRRLRLATVGLLQYIAPTIQFALAVGLYGEPFGSARFVAFALIWSAVALYTWDNFRKAGHRPQAAGHR